MERGGGGEAGAPTTAEPPAAAAAAGGVIKGKSCKGCLYFSSVLRSRSRGPVCVTRAIPEDFKYACVGYSIYLDDKENPTGKREKRSQAQLPICVGVEIEGPHLRKAYLGKVLLNHVDTNRGTQEMIS